MHYLSAVQLSPEWEGTSPYAEVDNVNGQEHCHDDEEVPHLEWLHRAIM